MNSIRDHMLGVMKFGLEMAGAANPLVGGSAILTGRNLGGNPMNGREYVDAAG